jgi:hypothetical protein
MNVLVMGSRIVGSALVFDLTIAYLNAVFSLPRSVSSAD